MIRASLLIALSALCLSFPATAQDVAQDFSAELPRIEPVSPKQALNSLEHDAQYHIDHVATEPLLGSPVAIEWDARGRMFVCEMRGYSEDQEQQLSTIGLLTDTDGDGMYDARSEFAKGLRWPTAIFPYKKGLFVGDAPHLYYMPDENEDGIADERIVVLTGFGTSNVQGLMNSMRWGLDNRIHIACSSTGGQIHRPGQPNGQPIRGRDIAFDPNTFAFETTSGAAQHGMCFDDWGRKFVSANSNHIMQVMYDDKDFARNPYMPAPASKISIATDGPQAEVFRASPVEPWRIVRTRLRVAGEVPGPVEGGGRAAGYFTGATGITIFKGDAWSPQHKGLAIIGDVGSNLIHRKSLKRQGLRFSANRIDERAEFIRSSDIWFRPVQFANAPDGSLHVIDMCREVIEHPKSLPPSIKQHLDLTSGRERGRILRVIAQDFVDQDLHQTHPTELQDIASLELVALLGHPNAWQRETAARLLFERQDKSTTTQLLATLRTNPAPLAQLHALYVLQGMEELPSSTLLELLTNDDTHPQILRHSLRLAYQNGWAEQIGTRSLSSLCNHKEIEVRFQAAILAGELDMPERCELLIQLAERDIGNPWMEAAVQSSVGDDASILFAMLMENEQFRGLAPQAFLRRLAAQISRQDEADQINRAMTSLQAAAQSEGGVPLPVVGELLRLREESTVFKTRQTQDILALLDEQTSKELNVAMSRALNRDSSTTDRVAAIEALAFGKLESVRTTLSELLGQAHPAEVQQAALKVLDRFDDAGITKVLLPEWPGMTPQIRRQALDIVLSRREDAEEFLRAWKQKRISTGLVTRSKLSQIRKTWPEFNALVSQAEAMLSPTASREEVITVYRDALTLDGSQEKGHKLFVQHCAVCHQLAGEGYALGPNLAAMKARGAEAILVNLLDPNREVNPQYLSYTALLESDRTASGMISSETSATVTFTKQQDQSVNVLRQEIVTLNSSGASLMPEGFEKQLDKQAVADLIAYLMSFN